MITPSPTEQGCHHIGCKNLTHTRCFDQNSWAHEIQDKFNDGDLPFLFMEVSFKRRTAELASAKDYILKINSDFHLIFDQNKIV